jgi:tRNA G18 (ribose-2'-O)-methylase SpoU
MSKFPKSIRNKLVGPDKLHKFPSDRETFSLSSLQHPVLKEMHALRRRFRDEKIFVRDGNLIRRLIGLGHTAHSVCVPGENFYWAQEAFRDATEKSPEFKVETVPRQVLEQICFGGNFHRGDFQDDAHLVCASFARPEIPEIPKDFGNFLVLDGVQNPSNAGLLAATAQALGWRGIFPINDTCDLFDHKSVAASSGAVMDIPILPKHENIFDFAADRRLLPVVAHVEGVQPERLDLRKYSGVMLIVGNEGRGPSEAILKVAARAKIPMAHAVDSLNVAVAGGILMNLFSGHF